MNFDELNKEQLEAVMSEHPRILCLAGAGTGKTKTMVTRAARLLDEGVEPENILMLTFTRAAAREQKERLIAMVGEAGEKVKAFTFHSWAVHEIRRHGRSLGYEPNFSIYDQEDTESIVTAIIEDLQYKLKPKDVMDAMMKNHLHHVPIPQGPIEKVAAEYRFRCMRQNAIDIDSLIFTLQALLNNSLIQTIKQSEYKYVFVDEFQDTDQRQMQLLQTLNPENLFVVGDDFQSIYGFRGADVTIIMELAYSSDWQTIKLEENYRSTHQIVDAANRLIKHNNQTEKILKAHRNGQMPALIEKTTPGEELDWIAGKCQRLEYCGERYSDIAVLARTNAQVQAIAERLSERDIAFTIKRHVDDALKTMDAKKLFAYMQAAINPQDDEAVGAVLNWPEQTLSRRERLTVEMFQLENGCSLLTALQAQEKAPEFVQRILTLQEFNKSQLPSAITLLDAIIQQTEIVWRNREQGLENRNKRLQDTRQAMKCWEETREEMGDTINPEDWLEFYKMRMIEGADPVEENEDAVQLMTVHGSKGLEFKNVIIAGLNQKSFPLGKGDIKEERRLMYVGMTRAKTRLYFTRSLTRIIWGNHMEEAEPSVFLEEL